MALNEYFVDFCERWREKASRYETVEIEDCVDKYFTLYVVFNALYVEAGRDLSGSDEGFSDKRGAIETVKQTIGAKALIQELNSNEGTKEAIKDLTAIMEHKPFYICLDSRTGEPLPDKDEELLEQLKSSNSGEKALGLLNLNYQVRCNLFHGRKGLELNQRQLFIPLITILDALVDALYKKQKKKRYVDRERL